LAGKFNPVASLEFVVGGEADEDARDTAIKLELDSDQFLGCVSHE
jgi:hypothetical protein